MSTNQYYCELCDYSGKNSQSKHQHIKTKKHIRNTELYKKLYNGVDDENLCTELINEYCILNKPSMVSHKGLLQITPNYSDYSDFTPNYSELLPNNNETTYDILNNEYISNKSPNGLKYFCTSCNQCFTRKYNLDRHVGRCKKKYENITQSLEQNTDKNIILSHDKMQSDKKENPKESKRIRENPKESKRIRENSASDNMEYVCEYCNKKFTTNSNMNRHINKNRCKNYNDNLNNQSINILINKVDEMFDENKEIKDELSKAIEKISDYENKQLVSNSINTSLTNHTINNTINNISGDFYNSIDTMNMNNINNLNMYFPNVIPMETFLYNMEYVNKITQEEAETLLYSSENMGIDDLANCFEKIITKNCKEQTKDMVHTNGMKMLSTIPILCTDGSMRSHKERLTQSWDTIYNDKNFEKMWNIVNDRVYELTNKYIFISNKNKKKLYSKVKQKVSAEELKNQAIELM